MVENQQPARPSEISSYPVPKILEKLRGPSFLEGFLEKGRMRPLLEAMPVRVILNDRTALYGPALYAANKA